MSKWPQDFAKDDWFVVLNGYRPVSSCFVKGLFVQYTGAIQKRTAYASGVICKFRRESDGYTQWLVPEQVQRILHPTDQRYVWGEAPENEPE